MSAAIPAGMVGVSKDQFFALLKADGRDIMPNNHNEDFTAWETKYREVWGWSAPGWKYPGPSVYAIALAEQQP